MILRKAFVTTLHALTLTCLGWGIALAVMPPLDHVINWAMSKPAPKLTTTGLLADMPPRPAFTAWGGTALEAAEPRKAHNNY